MCHLIIIFGTGEGKAWQSMLAEESIKGNVGLGAYIRIDTLSQGDVFVSHTVSHFLLKLGIFSCCFPVENFFIGDSFLFEMFPSVTR